MAIDIPKNLRLPGEDTDQSGVLAKYGISPPEASTSVGDVAKELAAGATSSVGSTLQGAGIAADEAIGSALERVLGKRPATRFFGKDPLEGVTKAIRESKSVEGELAQRQSTPTGDITRPSTVSLGEKPTVGGYLQQGANVIGQFVPQLAVAMATRRLSPGAQMATGAAVGGAQGAGAGASEEGARIRGMSHEQLLEASQDYAGMVKSGTAPEAAKEAVAQRAEVGGGIGSGIPSALEGVVEQALLRGKIKVPTIGKGPLARAASAVVGGGVTEGAEEVVEGIGQKAGANIATGGNQPVTADSFQNAVLGAIGGGAFGGAVHLSNPGETIEGEAPRVDTPAPAAPAGPMSSAAAVAKTTGATEIAKPGALPSDDEAKAPLFAFTESGAQTRAGILGKQGQAQRVIPHPEREGRFAVIPDEYGAAGDDAGRIAALVKEANTIIDRIPEGKPLTAGVTKRLNEIDAELLDLRTAEAERTGAQKAAQKEGKGTLATGKVMGDEAGGSDLPHEQRLAAALAKPAFERTAAEMLLVKRAARDTAERAQPIAVETSRARTVDAGAHEAAASPKNDRAEPSPAQIEAVNYKKGPVKFGPFNGRIENPEGSVRRSKPGAPVQWESTLTQHYGHFSGYPAKAPDGEDVDLFLKPGTPVDHRGPVWVIDQDNEAGNFDEPKAMAGYASKDEAVQAYLSNYQDRQKDRIRGVTELTADQLLERLDDAKAFRQPQAETRAAEKRKAEPVAEASSAPRAPEKKVKPAEAVKSMQSDVESAIDRAKGPSIVRTISAAVDDTEKQTAAAAKAQAEAKRKEPKEKPKPAPKAVQFEGVAYSRKGKAQLVAIRATKETGQKHRVAPHRTEAGKWIVEKGEALPEVKAMTPGSIAAIRADPLLKWIKEQGGIDSAVATDIYGETSFRANQIMPGLFWRQSRGRTGQIIAGHGIDDLATRAAEEGFLTPQDIDDVDGGTQALKDKVASALRGERQIRMGHDEEAQFESMRPARFSPEDLDASGVTALPEDEQKQAVDAANIAVTEARRDWDKMTPEEKDAQLDEIFGKADDSQESPATSEDGGEEADASDARPGSEATGEERGQVEEGRRKVAAPAPADDGKIEEPGATYFTTYEIPESTGAHRAESGGHRDSPPQGTLPGFEIVSYKNERTTPTEPRRRIASAVEKSLSGGPVRNIRVGTFRSGIRQVTSSRDAAHILAPLRKEQNEAFWALVLDAKKAPIGVFEFFKGGRVQTAAYTGVIAQTLHSVPGARYVYFAHNHPSGVAQPSRSDVHLSENIDRIFEKTGIDVLGHLVVAETQATEIPTAHGGDARAFPIPAYARTIEVPSLKQRVDIPRRHFGKDSKQGVGNPQAVRDFIRKVVPRSGGTVEQGLLVLDSQNRPIQWMPLTTQEMMNLQTGRVGTGVSKLYQEFNKSWAASIIAVVGENSPEVERAIMHLKNFASFADVRLLDTVSVSNDGSAMMSYAERGLLSVADSAGEEERAAEALRILSENSALFRYPVSDDMSFPKVMAAIDPGFKAVTDRVGFAVVQKLHPGIVRWYEITAPNGATAELFENKDKEVWISISAFDRGTGGSAVYAAAANYAFNNGLTFIGDPYGISDEALVRRTENMLSSALKFGTTRHIEPGARQLEGDEDLGVKPLPWSQEDDAANLRSLLKATYDKVLREVPEIEDIRYNFEHGRFEDKSGHAVGDDRFVALADTHGALQAVAGRNTLKRAALIGSLLREGGGEGRQRILGEVLRQSRLELDPQLRDIFYSRSASEPRPRAGVFASTVDSIQREIGLEVGKTKAARVKVVQSWADLPAPITKHIFRSRAFGVQGYFDPETDSAYLIADNIRPHSAFSVLMHEVGVHKGLEGFIGAENVMKLANQVRLWSQATGSDRHVELARRAAVRIPRGTPRGQHDQELIAYFVEEAIQAGYGKPKPKDKGLIASWFRALWEACQSALKKLGLHPESLNVDDIVSLARGALERTLAGGTVAPLNLRAMASQSSPIFYSGLLRGVEGLSTNAATADAWKGAIRNLKGVKADEIEWSGIMDWLDMIAESSKPGDTQVSRDIAGATGDAFPDGKVTKRAVMEHLAENGVKVGETVLGASTGSDERSATSRIDRLRVELDALGYDTVDDHEGLQGVERRSDGRVFMWNDVDGFEDDDGVGGAPPNVAALGRQLGEAVDDRIREEEGVHAADSDDTRYRQYTMPGGKNYRELLLTIPERPARPSTPEWKRNRAGMWAWFDGDLQVSGAFLNNSDMDAARAGIGRVGDAANFHAGHFAQPNVVAHVRFDERTDADGKRVLFIEEIQSDWAQKGKREGFTAPAKEIAGLEAKERELRERRRQLVSERGARWVGSEEYKAIQAEESATTIAISKAKRGLGIPSAPFVGKTESWVALSMKRVIRYAVDNGFDRVAWTTGEQQADRYDLSKHIESIKGYRNADGSYWLKASRKGYGENDDFIAKQDLSASDMAEIIGKDATDKLIEAIDANERLSADRVKKAFVRLSGLDLKVGGEGMRAFYDKIVPNVAGDILKRLGGGQVGAVSIKFGNAPDDVVARHRDNPEFQKANTPQAQPGFDVTPEMAKTAVAGLPMFSIAPAAAREADGAAPVRARLMQRMKDIAVGGQLAEDEGVLNAWNKTVGTPELVARKNPKFAKVFWEGQQYLTDVNKFISESEGMLPAWFKGQDILSRWFDRVRGREVVQAEKAAEALLDGTLANTVYTDAQLRARGLSAREIGMYEEARFAVDQIIEKNGLALIGKVSPAYASTAKAMLEAYRTGGMAAIEEFSGYSETLGKANVKRLERELGQTEVEARRKSLNERLQAEKLKLEEWQTVSRSMKRIVDLQNEGYFPLSRFGRYFVNVTDPRGETVEFRMYEGEALARVGAAQLQQKYPGSYKIERGTISQDTPELFRGLTPESVELFAEITGMSEDPAMQRYLKEAVANRSTLKRMIHRKGTPGYSKDAVRVLADFISSNARYWSRLHHFDNLTKFAHDIQGGELRDYAIQLVKYLRGDDAREEFQTMRSFLFFQYIGGNLSSAFLNLTQVPLFGLPWLNQHTNMPNAGRLIKKGYVLGAREPETVQGELGVALARAEAEGITNPQNVYTTMAIGSGSKLARVRAFSGLLDAWAFLFSKAETLNRRVMFIAGYDLAQQKGLRGEEAFHFASQAVRDTQFIYNKGNRPVWARGIGAIPFTFKLFSIQALETISSRLPPRQAALLLAMMFLAAGAEGLPFAEDLEDLIDALGQKLGYTTNSKRWLAEHLQAAFQEWMGLPPETALHAAEMVRKGVFANTALASMGARVGMGNLIPGTAIFQTGRDSGSEIIEAGGPAAGVARNLAQAAEFVSRGEIGRAAEKALPSGLGNIVKGARQLDSGEEVTPYGKRVAKVSTGEAALQLAGISAASPGRVRERQAMIKQDEAFLKTVEDRIADKWAQGLMDKDPAKVREAREELKAHNERNPESKIRITPQQIQSRVKNMRRDGVQNVVRSVAKERRGPAREFLRGIE